jgi:hypothetical protein
VPYSVTPVLQWQTTFIVTLERIVATLTEAFVFIAVITAVVDRIANVFETDAAIIRTVERGRRPWVKV